MEELEVAKAIARDRFPDHGMPPTMTGFRAELVGTSRGDNRWRCSWSVECLEGSSPKHIGYYVDNVCTADAALARAGVRIVDGRLDRAGFEQVLAHADPVIVAREIATHAHAGATRKHGPPYIHHPLNVARLAWEAIPGVDLELVCAALLHDVLEDTTVTSEELAQRVGKSVTELVKELTRPKGMTRQEYFADFRNQKKSRKAVLLKLADRIDNLSDIVLQPDREWAARYIKETETYLVPIAGFLSLREQLERALDRAREFVTGATG